MSNNSNIANTLNSRSLRGISPPLTSLRASGPSLDNIPRRDTRCTSLEGRIKQYSPSTRRTAGQHGLEVKKAKRSANRPRNYPENLITSHNLESHIVYQYSTSQKDIWRPYGDSKNSVWMEKARVNFRRIEKFWRLASPDPKFPRQQPGPSGTAIVNFDSVTIFFDSCSFN